MSLPRNRMYTIIYMRFLILNREVLYCERALPSTVRGCGSETFLVHPPQLFLLDLPLATIMKNYSLQAGGGEGGFKTVANVPVYELGSEIRAALSSLYIQQLK